MTEKTTASAEPPGDAGPTESLRQLARRVLSWLAARNMFVVMAGFFLLGFLANRVPALAPHAWVFFLTGGLLPMLLATIPTEHDGYEYEMSNVARAKYLLTQLVWAITPWGLYTQALQIGGTLFAYVRYRGRLPNRERHVPETDLSLPLEGEWTTANGGVTKPTSHSWGIVSQRYAYDFVVAGEDGETHEGDGTALTDYHAFGEPLLAPADGTVVKTEDSLRDFPRPGSGWLEWRTWNIAGNHVVIEHADGEYSMLAHLKQGSVAVEPGEEVTRGQVVGECGNSGFSSEPHLHFQLMDSQNFWFAAGLVPRFVETVVSRDDDRREGRDVYETAREDADWRYLWAGDRVVTERD
ncbi:M23 family metallopeptidase [Haloarchaeobius amylolyticus]|uniref:M23 family metallopeptidase n=1 Tax=Haloarchaeobius amylolyticus TaxID=1198296 RepID=UPI00226EF48E|nr:M23 family metallopeptidase [Haloarchaeobius amylolyticus]